MIYLDANFFIFALLDTTEKGRNARAMLSAITDGEEKAITSVLALDEVMWSLITNDKEHLVESETRRIYRTANIDVKSVHRSAGLQAIDTLDTLTPRDALHLSVMRRHDCTRIVSDDRDFDTIGDINRVSFADSSSLTPKSG